MFGKKKKEEKQEERTPDEMLEELQAQDDIIEGVDEVPLEDVPQQDLLVNVVTQDKDHWRFFALVLLVSVMVLIYFLKTSYDALEKRPIYVYNQSVGDTVEARVGGYQAEGFLASVARGVSIYSTWSVGTFNNTIGLVKDMFDDSLIKSAVGIYKKKKNVWLVNDYRQALSVKKAYWPTDEKGMPMKWQPGMPSFTVRVEGDFTRTNKDGKKTVPITIDVQCNIITPSIEHPHGFVIVNMKKVKAS